MQIKYKSLNDYELAIRYVSLLNTARISDENMLLHATEMKLLAYFLCLDYEKYKHRRFTVAAKRKVIEMAEADGWNLTVVNITNKIQTLIKKGFLYRDEDKVIYVRKAVMKYWLELKQRGELNVTFKLEINE